MTREELAKPDNAGDRTVMIEISGNRLVFVLNALDSALFAAGRYHYAGNDLVTSSQYFARVRATTEAIRDELACQRGA